MLFFIILILLILVLMVSIAETAVVSSSLAEAYTRYGDKKGIHGIVKLKKNVGQVVAVLLIYDIFFSTICTHLMIESLTKLSAEWLKIYISPLVAIFFVIYEVTMKTYAINDAERILYYLSGFLSVITFPMKPIAVILDRFAKKFTTVFLPKNQKESEEDMSLKEIKSTVDFHHSLFPSEESAMLRNIITLNDTTLDQIMTHRKDFFQIQIRKVTDLVNSLTNAPHSEVVVWENHQENVVGTLKCSEIWDFLYQHNDLTDKDLIPMIKLRIRKPKFILETSTISTLLNAFRYRGKGVYIVVNEYGAVMGLVTETDVLNFIVGNLEITTQRYITKNNNGYILYGEAPIRELNRIANWNINNDYLTASGMVMAAAKHMPEEGREYEIDGFKIKVLRANEKTVIFLYIEKRIPPAIR